MNQPAPKKPQQSPADKEAAGAIAAPETPPVAPQVELSRNIELADLRKECIKLTYSANKSVFENLGDAEIVTAWVLTGEKPKESTA